MFTMFFLAQIFLGCTVIHGAILGEQNKNVILPCSFKPEEEVVIHWTTRDKKNVHSYYWTKDQLEKQDKSYSGRTSLFLKEISEGNASLQIRNLRKSDENTYKCYVGRKADHKEEEISLQVIGAILGEQNREVILPCSFKPGEEVVIHWTTRDKINVHSYYWTKDQLEKQDKSYSGRTSLFLKEISEGNASLQIRNLRKSDENTYKCYVGTKADHKEEIISLQVIVFFAIMGKTADLTAVQKAVIETLHEVPAFQFSFGNQGPRVWRKSGEAHNPSCLRSSVKFPQSVMVWGAMSSAGVGPLCFIKTKVSAPVYQEILEHFMLPSADKLFGDRNVILQQDLAPVHTAKSTNTWFTNNSITVLDWPANSPDLYPIENLWVLSKGR
ncbi:HERV-H LTR-associating protein 2 isoform X2 [Phyllobates terribilis]|uniref:HERV-H LTR-associating protein 2 isoform X2 n=1 Tax=Phyllobates terribilis TaxID=111132 RepID=UPI003CCAB104